MNLKSLRKLVETASDQKGGWESYRAREKAQAELLHYMPLLLSVAERAKVYVEQVFAMGDGLPASDEEMREAITALEGK